MSEEKLESKDERHMSFQQNFLCSCAGADKSILKQCPTEWNKYACIGATILFTGILASLSGGYALFTVFRGGDGAIMFAVFFGVLWGLIIFNLDRFIVSTFWKVADGKRWQKFLRELLHASPRIILAIIIAIVISKPVEIKIFENRLSEQIKRNEIAAKKDNVNDFYGIHKIDDKKDNVSALDASITTAENERNIDPPEVQNLQAGKRQAEQRLEKKRAENNSLIQTHRQDIAQIESNRDNYSPIYDGDGNIVGESITKEANDKLSSHNSAIRSLNQEIRTLQNQVNRLERQITIVRNEYRVQKDEQIATLREDKSKAESVLNDAIATAEREASDANKVSERAFSNNFISQIEALGDLTSTNRTMEIVSLFLTLLFLTIELAPILTKLITKRGPYEEILERTEYELMIEQKSLISRKNSEVNELLEQAENAAKLRVEIINRLEKDQAEAELKTNKKLLEEIAAKQEILAMKAIDKWYEEELKKL